MLDIIMLRPAFVARSPSTESVSDTGSEPESVITLTVPHAVHWHTVRSPSPDFVRDSLASSPVEMSPQPSAVPVYETDPTEDWWAYALSGV